MTKMPINPATARDLRIDFCRGLALYMILVDHVIGDPISRLTLGNFGFCDAAEAFIFLSGLSCGIVYFRVLRRGGWAALAAAICRRASQIYIYYVAASVVTILILKAAEGKVNNAHASHSFVVLREAPIPAIWSTFSLTSPPDLPGILVIYLAFAVIVIPIFLWGASFNALLTLAASGLVWAISQSFPNWLPHLADHSYFNPLAWQFLFCIGMFVGLRYASDLPRPRTTQISRWLVTLAWAYVIFALVHRYRFELQLSWLPALANDKANLSYSRLLHFLSIAFLFSTYIRPNNPVFSRWPATVVIRTGQSSLAIFCIGTILSELLSLVFVLWAPSRLEKVALDGVAIVLMALIALALTQARKSRENAPGPARKMKSVASLTSEQASGS